jgi:cold shock CspA family protein
MDGRMLWFNAEKGFGFIETEDGERLYVHESGFEPGQVPTRRCADTPVTFEREAADVEGGFQAIHVSVVSDVAGRRARSRRRSFG